MSCTDGRTVGLLVNIGKLRFQKEKYGNYLEYNLIHNDRVNIIFLLNSANVTILVIDVKMGKGNEADQLGTILG